MKNEIKIRNFHIDLLVVFLAIFIPITLCKLCPASDFSRTTEVRFRNCEYELDVDDDNGEIYFVVAINDDIYDIWDTDLENLYYIRQDNIEYVLDGDKTMSNYLCITTYISFYENAKMNKYSFAINLNYQGEEL